MARINRDLKPRRPTARDDFATAGGDDVQETEDATKLRAEESAEAVRMNAEMEEYFGAGPPPAAPAGNGKAEVRAAGREAGGKKKVKKVKKEAAPPAAVRPTHAMGGPRGRLGPKAKKNLRLWNAENSGRTRLGLICARVEMGRKRYGQNGVFHGSQTKNLVVGIPVPALSFEFVISQDAFPLGLVMQLVAKHGTGKSALLAEFARWFDDAGGLTSINENETKFSPEWYESIMGSEAFERMQLNRCDSVESWQDHLTYDIHGPNSFKKDFEGTKAAPGPGRTVPVLFGVDSIMGKMSRQSQDNIRKEGSAGRSHPIEAQFITKYMRTVPQWLDGWPFAIVLVNHLKIKRDEVTGQDEREKGGGALVNFQESFELELRKSGPKKIETEDYEGFQVEISCEKNSFGPTHRKIKTRVLWWEECDEESGEWRQKTIWDWDWSTTQLLYSIIDGGKNNVRLRRCLKDADFHMAFSSPTAEGATAWSRTLGVPQGDPLLWNEMGALIRTTPEVRDMLRKALRIKRRPLLEGNYLDQLGKMAEDLP
jgi:hypothetical protein